MIEQTDILHKPLFEKEKGELIELISKARHNSTAYSKFTHFLKGDISGIQDFIFNVKSEKAAKTLKARSYFVQALSEICVQVIFEKLNGDALKLYNGGGNFYLFVNKEVEKKLPEIRKAINEACKEEEFYVTLSVIEVEDFENGFGENTWRKIQEESAKDKLNKFKGFKETFESYPVPKAQSWEKFTPNFVWHAGGIIEKEGNTKLKIDDKSIEVLDHKMRLTDAVPKSQFYISFKNSIVNKIPRWTDDLIDQHEKALDIYYADNPQDKPKKGKGDDKVIDFSELAIIFAKTRTGTGKLAVLKMDIDGLGNIMDGVKSSKDLSVTSDLIKWFFENFMLKLWQQQFTWFKTNENGETEECQEDFKNNIYTVFSGGDDCFLLGAWDAVFEFALLFQKEFNAFADFLEKKIHSIGKKPTISAGLIVVDPHFPVVRFARLAEEALEKSKDKPSKNRITIFNQTLTWDEFATAESVGKKLRKLIQEKGESRAVLERIKWSAKGFENLQDDAINGNVRAPKVSRLFYFLRNVKKENLPEMDKIVQGYSNSLIAAYQDRKTVNPMTYPVGARWAEFLTR